MSPLWPFPTKDVQSQSRRIDQGWDLQYPGVIPVPVLAVESGVLENAGPDPQGFGPGYPVLRLSKAAPGGPAVYYGHTFTNKALVGQHVPKGTPIGMTGGPHSGGNAYNDPNWLEIGFWDNGPIGNGSEMQSWLTGASVENAWWIEVVLPPGTLKSTFPVYVHGSQPSAGSKVSGGVIFLVSGPYNSKADAQKAWNDKSYLGHIPPGPTGTQPEQPLTHDNPLQSFLAGLSSRDLWVRVAEVVAGGLILVIGIAALIKDTPTGKAIINTAAKAGVSVL